MKQALSAANLVMIVTLPDAASYATLPMMESLVKTYCSSRPDFIDHAYVINQIDSSRQLARDVTQVMRSTFGDRIVGLIHQDQSVCEALAFDKSVLDYDTQCQATQDFRECALWVTNRLNQQGVAG
jgi:cellulose biosynthesis protein BcsQ